MDLLRRALFSLFSMGSALFSDVDAARNLFASKFNKLPCGIQRTREKPVFALIFHLFNWLPDGNRRLLCSNPPRGDVSPPRHAPPARRWHHPCSGGFSNTPLWR